MTSTPDSEEIPASLAGVFAVLSAPGRASELTGHAAALTAFRGEPARPGLRDRVKRPLFVALAAATVLGGAGIAVALPAVQHAPARPAHRAAPVAPTLLHKSASPAPPPVAPTPTPTARPDYKALCREAARSALRRHGARSLPEADLSTLARAAGGREKIPAFCFKLLTTPHPYDQNRDRKHKRPRDRDHHH